MISFAQIHPRDFAVHISRHTAYSTENELLLSYLQQLMNSWDDTPWRISSDGRMLGSCANQSCSLHRNKATCCLVHNALDSWLLILVEVLKCFLFFWGGGGGGGHGSFLCVLKLVVEVCSHINTSFIVHFVTRLNLCQRCRYFLLNLAVWWQAWSCDQFALLGCFCAGLK